MEAVFIIDLSKNIFKVGNKLESYFRTINFGDTKNVYNEYFFY